MNRIRERGFVLMDVLLAVFLFTLGFAAIFGLSETALKEAEQALRFTEAGNHAQSILESLAAEPWQDNFNAGRCIPGGEVKGGEGLFRWRIISLWDVPGLLRVRVEVFWLEQGKTQQYILETLYATD